MGPGRVGAGLPVRLRLSEERSQGSVQLGVVGSAHLYGAGVGIGGVYVMTVDQAPAVLEPQKYANRATLSRQASERALVVNRLFHLSP